MKGNFLRLAALAGLALTSSAMATGTYNTGFGLAVAIPDNNPAGTSTNLVVPSDGVNGDVIVSINVGIAIQHTWQGDLRIRLTHVGSGNSITLVDRPGYNGTGFGFNVANYGVPGTTLMMFKDSAASIYDSPTLPTANVVGDWKPEGPSTLGFNFGGLSAAGTWSLSVSDNASADTGVIDAFSLEIVTQQTPAPGALGLLGLGGLAAIRRRRRAVAVAAAAAGLAIGSSAMAQFGTGPNEVEDNNNKAQANTNGGTWTLPAALGTTAGVVAGTTTGTSTTTAGLASADYFRLRTAAQGTLAIYRNRLTITTQGTAGHTGNLVGLPQSGAASDTTFAQTSSTATTPARFNQFYSFGRASDMYYRVTGGAATTAPYSVDYDLAVVTPKAAGGFTAGNFIVQTAGQSSLDTEMFLYDANFNQIGQNDDRTAANGGGLQSRIDIALAAGTYYLAVGDFNTAGSLPTPAVSLGSAGVDGTASGNRLDFVDNLARASTAARAVGGAAFNISIGDGIVTTLTPSDAQGAYDMQWYSFTVVPVPAPGAMALLGLGGLVAARRRRA